MATNEFFMAWLNDAYGMEKSLIQVLEHQVKDAEGNPMVQSKLQQHLEQTRQHADRVQQCIEQLGGSTSSLKSGMATLGGIFQAVSTGPAEDEMIKNALQDYSAESLEVASYKSLIAAAFELGEATIATSLQQNLREDQEMQAWLEQNIDSLTKTFLRTKQTAGVR